MPILETKSEAKVTVAQKLDGTLLNPKTHSHNKFGIPTSNNTRYTQGMFILKTNTEVKFKVIVTRKEYKTFHHLKMHPHTKLGNPISIDSFHIVSAHAPNSLVPRYLREITREGATCIRLSYITQWNMEND